MSRAETHTLKAMVIQRVTHYVRRLRDVTPTALTLCRHSIWTDELFFFTHHYCLFLLHPLVHLILFLYLSGGNQSFTLVVMQHTALVTIKHCISQGSSMAAQLASVTHVIFQYLKTYVQSDVHITALMQNNCNTIIWYTLFWSGTCYIMSILTFGTLSKLVLLYFNSSTFFKCRTFTCTLTHSDIQFTMT